MPSPAIDDLRARLDLESVIRELIPGLGRTGSNGEASARCLWHDDQNPSMGVNVRDGVYVCRVCGAGGGILHLWARVRGGTTADAFRALAARAGIATNGNGAHPAAYDPERAGAGLTPSQSPNGRPAVTEAQRGRIVATYDYRDVDGALLYQAVRYADPKGFRQRRPNGRGGWHWNVRGVQQVPYRLPELTEGVALGRTVYIVEGEKDADRLSELGLTATTNAGGAGKWRPEFNTSLAGADVIILPDNDEPGRRHAASVARDLADVAASIKIVELPDVPEHGDVSDWLDTGRTVDELVAMIDAAVPFEATAVVEVAAPTVFYPNTDLGNARRFRDRYGDNVRHVAGRSWYAFDGAHWKPDADGESMRRAKELTDEMLAAAEAIADSAERKKATQWALRTQSRGGLAAIVDVASTERPIAATLGDFDADPWLLNTPSGAIDLRSGEPRPNRREDMCSKITGAAFDPAATCPQFERFLTRTFDGNEELIAFVQRAAGYSLTGSTREQVLFIAFGSGNNGKGVMFETFRHVVGTYQSNATFDLLTARRNGGASPDIARLAGARFVTASEAEATHTFNESVLKSLTGGDRLTARLLHQNPVEFDPQFKLWLATNHRPIITGTDHAIWRRVLLIPFTVTIPREERDPELTTRLRSEASGILNWMLAGCAAWQRDGLTPPDAVQYATQEYRRDMDPLAGFFETCIERVDDAATPVGLLYATYRAWAQRSGEPVMTSTAFGTLLGDRGHVLVDRRSALRKRKGLRLSAYGEQLHTATDFRSRASEPTSEPPF